MTPKFVISDQKTYRKPKRVIFSEIFSKYCKNPFLGVFTDLRVQISILAPETPKFVIIEFLKDLKKRIVTQDLLFCF